MSVMAIAPDGDEYHAAKKRRCELPHSWLNFLVNASAKAASAKHHRITSLSALCACDAVLIVKAASHSNSVLHGSAVTLIGVGCACKSRYRLTMFAAQRGLLCARYWGGIADMPFLHCKCPRFFTQ